jgi:peptidoglycan/LPS O-acetylase OafA/YrhL
MNSWLIVSGVVYLVCIAWLTYELINAPEIDEEKDNDQNIK